MKPASERWPLTPAALAQIFLEARTPNSWASSQVEEPVIRRLYELARFGPTSANTNPMRIVWVRSAEGKHRLAASAHEKNRPKILEAPVTAVIGYDLAFADRLDVLFPHNHAAIQALALDEGWRDDTAFRNGTLQGAYLIIAARALGLDCGPLSGFDKAQVDAAFFEGTATRSNFLCCLGYGADRNLFPRLPRLAFDDANRFA
ncbi:MAG: malonic semialdehyde reductase [Phenylobacterium sp.]